MDNIDLTVATLEEVGKFKRIYYAWHSDVLNIEAVKRNGQWRIDTFTLASGVSLKRFKFDTTDWQIDEGSKLGAHGPIFNRSIEGFIRKHDEPLESYLNEMARRPLVIVWEDFNGRLWLLGGAKNCKARLAFKKSVDGRTGYNVSITNAGDESSMLLTANLEVDPLAQLLYDAADTEGAPLVEPYRTRLNDFFTVIRADGLIPYVKFMVVDAMIDDDYTEADRKKVVVIDMINATIKSTIHNNYTGAHLAGVGFKGDISGAFGLLTPYNASALFTQNNFTVGYLCLSTTGAASSWDLCAIVASTTYSLAVRPHYNDGEFVLNQGASLGTPTYKVPRAFNKQWRRVSRTGANLTHEYDNGMLVGIDTGASAAPANVPLTRLAYYDGSWGFYSSGIQGALYGSTGTWAQNNLLEERINDYLLKPIGKASYMDKELMGIGDSIFSGQAQGLYSAMYQETIAALNDAWTLTNKAESGAYIVNIDTDANTRIVPYARTWFKKRVAWIHAGTNDIVGGDTGGGVYTKTKSLATKLTNAGWTVIISGLIDRQGLGGGQAAFNTAMTAYNNAMLADFTSAHPTIDDYWLLPGGSWAHGFVHTFNNPKFADATDTTYFNVDQTHLNATGNTAYKNEICYPIMLTL